MLTVSITSLCTSNVPFVVALKNFNCHCVCSESINTCHTMLVCQSAPSQAMAASSSSPASPHQSVQGQEVTAEGLLASIPEDWRTLVLRHMQEDELRALLERVAREYRQLPNQIFPAPHDVFRALTLCPVATVRVVILGQGGCCCIVCCVQQICKSLNSQIHTTQSAKPKGWPFHANLSLYSQVCATFWQKLPRTLEVEPSATWHAAS